MKIEKAIETLKDMRSIFGERSHNQYSLPALDLAISALEKQLNGGWIPFKIEYDRYFKMDMLQGKIPEEDQEIFVTDGGNVWSDTFMRDGVDCYLDSGNSLIDKVIAWRPLPEPYKEVENE